MNKKNEIDIGDKVPSPSPDLIAHLDESRHIVLGYINTLRDQKDVFAKYVLLRNFEEADSQSIDILNTVNQAVEFLYYVPVKEPRKDFRSRSAIRFRVIHIKKNAALLEESYEKVELQSYMVILDRIDDVLKEIIMILDYYKQFGIVNTIPLRTKGKVKKKKFHDKEKSIKRQLDNWKKWVREDHIRGVGYYDPEQEYPLSTGNDTQQEAEVEETHIVEGEVDVVGNMTQGQHDEELYPPSTGNDTRQEGREGFYEEIQEDRGLGATSLLPMHQLNKKNVLHLSRNHVIMPSVNGPNNISPSPVTYKLTDIVEEIYDDNGQNEEHEEVFRGYDEDSDTGNEDVGDDSSSDVFRGSGDQGYAERILGKAVGPGRTIGAVNITEERMEKWESLLEDVVEEEEDYRVETGGRGEPIRRRRIHQDGGVGKVEVDSREVSSFGVADKHSVEISQLIRAKQRAEQEGWSVSKEVSDFAEDGLAIGSDVRSYHDVIKKDPYIADNVMEQKGRVNPPLHYIRMYPDLWMGDGRKVAGVDVARYGDDRTVIAVRYGMHVVDIQCYAKQGTVETVGRIVSCIKEWELDEVVIDVTGGLGAAVVDMLRKNEIDEYCLITCVHFNDEPRSNRLNAFNARAEMYLLFGEKSGNGEISLPSDEELLEEFVAIDYEYSMAGDGDKLKLYPKEKTRKALGRSPDKSDAVVLAYYDRPALVVY